MTIRSFFSSLCPLQAQDRQKKTERYPNYSDVKPGKGANPHIGVDLASERLLRVKDLLLRLIGYSHFCQIVLFCHSANELIKYLCEN